MQILILAVVTLFSVIVSIFRRSRYCRKDKLYNYQVFIYNPLGRVTRGGHISAYKLSILRTTKQHPV